MQGKLPLMASITKMKPEDLKIKIELEIIEVDINKYCRQPKRRNI